MKYIVILIALFTTLNGLAYGKEPQSTVKVIELKTTDPLTYRPIKLRIWYPAGFDTDCEKSQICLAPNVQQHHTILLMHGAMGSVKSHNWLGYAMASQGIVVVGIDHFGESWSYGIETMNPSTVMSLGLRPADVSATLNQLSANQLQSSNKVFSNIKVNWNNVTAIGHSSGGMAALLLAGAQADKSLALDYCQSKESKGDRSCLYTKGLKKLAAPTHIKQQSFKDTRIKRLIALDPAGGHLLTSKSLKNIDSPLLIVGSVNNDFLPFNQHAKRYATLVSHSTLVTLNNGEGHFVYLDACTHTHKAMGVSLCEDREGVSRKSVHEKLYPEIFRFIYSNQ